MTELNQIYKCNLCDNIVEVIHPGQGELNCCGQAMTLLKENSTDAATEKHVPVINKTESSILVKIGSVLHPMGEDHYIEFIELIADGKIYRKYLKPGDQPVAAFQIAANEVKARAYCNLHGLWMK